MLSIKNINILIRVGIIISEELSPDKNKKTSWLGGLNYYKNVVSAVYKLPERKIEIVVFVNSDASAKFVNQFSDAEIVYSPLVNFLHDSAGSMKFKKPFAKVWFYLLSKIKSKRYLVEQLFLKNGVDVNCYGEPLLSDSIKSICWIADFQQMNHPEFFSENEDVNSRNSHVNWLIEKSDSVILSSETALADLRRYNSSQVEKARVLKFIPAINLNVKVTPINQLREKYQFEGNYFYMPNQFWKHKNHKVVIRALNYIVNEKKKPIQFLASGSLTDFRNINHVQDLIDEINAFKLTQNIHLLGVIPYLDVLSLMHFSMAVINPSFSEGWSSTVEEAKQLKVPLILSDIPIHQEQTKDNQKAILFDPNDELELATILMNCKVRDFSDDFDYHSDFFDKQTEFALIYQDIIMQTLKNKLH